MRVFACAALAVIQLSLSSCASRQAFQILAHPTAYALKSPDSSETPFTDILRAYNGYQPGHNSIDLRPLMRLRIENAYYQAGASRRGLQGFLGTEVAYYLLRPDGLHLLSVQPMKERPQSDLPVQDLIPSTQMHARFYRLYFEIVFARRNNSHGSVLLAANSMEELNQLSAALDNPDDLCGRASAHCTAFPEACTVSIEIQVTVNGTSQAILWNSTLLSVLGKLPRRLALKRLYAGRLLPVKINPNDAEALRLPLLPGDQINTN